MKFRSQAAWCVCLLGLLGLFGCEPSPKPQAERRADFNPALQQMREAWDAKFRAVKSGNEVHANTPVVFRAKAKSAKTVGRPLGMQPTVKIEGLCIDGDEQRQIEQIDVEHPTKIVGTVRSGWVVVEVLPECVMTTRGAGKDGGSQHPRVAISVTRVVFGE